MNSGQSGQLYQKLVAGDTFNIATVLNDQTNTNIQRMNIECNTVGSGAINIQLPSFTYLQSYLNFEIVITDTGNNAGTNNINVVPAGSNTINQTSSFVIDVNKGSAYFIGATQNDWEAFKSWTPALSFSNQEPNIVFAGPASGSPAAPTFRTLVQADFYKIAQATLDFPATDPQLSSELTIALSGAQIGDPVLLGTPAAPDANSCYTAYVSATNVVTVRFNNYSVGIINPGSGLFKVAILNP